MAEVSTGLKKKLSISPCIVSTDGTVTVGSEKFDVMLNPSSYKHTRSIKYNQKPVIGQVAPDSKFGSIDAENVSFDIIIDGTGVVAPSDPNASPSNVKTQIQTLNCVVYKYQGNDHQPNPVRLLWGSLIFFGRLKKMDVEYNLFKPSGEPLRARVGLEFTGFMSKEQEKLEANRSSPDLTHFVEVKVGDTLPLLCHRIYRDSSYYVEVARVNNLVNFRRLEPGTLVHFPPLS